MREVEYERLDYVFGRKGKDELKLLKEYEITFYMDKTAFLIGKDVLYWTRISKEDDKREIEYEVYIKVDEEDARELIEMSKRLKEIADKYYKMVEKMFEERFGGKSELHGGAR